MSMFVDNGIDASWLHAFQNLSTLVREWCGEGRTTTTAGLKPAMQQRDPAFSESVLGFETFRKFVEAAEEAGHVRTVRQPGGHTLVLPPEAPAPAPTPPAGTSTPVAAAEHVSAPAPGSRLRQEVWTVFVDWQHGQDRRWDTRTQRPFMFPVDPDGSPAWITAPSRFHPVQPVTQDVQLGWMREWAETLAEPVRAEIVRSLDGGLGQFRRELDAHGLASEWRTELQRRVADHVLEWAREHAIPWRDLFDQRTRPRPAVPATGTAVPGTGSPGAPVVSPAPPPVTPPQATTPAPVPTPAARTSPSERSVPSPEDGDTARLRALLHRAVDRMSPAELCAIPVRAEHLLDRG